MSLRADLASLVSSGYKRRSFTLLGNVVEMQTLRVEEELRVEEMLLGMDLLTRQRLKEVKILAYATVCINGVPFTREEQCKEAEEFFRGLQIPVRNIFWDRYQELVLEQAEFVQQIQTQSESKMTTEQVQEREQEVKEDLKESEVAPVVEQEEKKTTRKKTKSAGGEVVEQATST